MVADGVAVEGDLYLAASLLCTEWGIPERVQDLERRMRGRMEFDIPRHEIVAENEGRVRPRFPDKPLHEDASVDYEVRTVDPSIPG